MITLIRTDAFAKWLKELADATGRARILARLRAIEMARKLEERE